MREWRVTRFYPTPEEGENQGRDESFSSERAARMAFELAVLDVDRGRGGSRQDSGMTMPLARVVLSSREVIEWEQHDEYPEVN